MERDPTHYSRLLVILGLFPLLVFDLAVGLPDGAFVAGGAVVLAVATGVHYRGGEVHAAGGWLLFGAALALVAVVDVTAHLAYTAVFAVLLLSGLLLLVGEQRRSGEGA